MIKKIETRTRKKIIPNELENFKRLLTLYPTGILSVVSDSFDLWKVITEYLPKLKDQILARDGKLVIRPDSGDPVDIICGTYPVSSDVNLLPRNKGVIELLWDTFGGTINKQGYKVLDSHIGAIYGDGITLDRATQICERLKAKGFGSSNIVFGIGSYAYQYNTRDTFGIAMKSTYVEMEENFLATPESVEWGVRTIGRAIYKDPITDDGVKKSASGLLSVVIENDEYKLLDNVTWEQEQKGELKTVFENGQIIKEWSLHEIRERCK